MAYPSPLCPTKAATDEQFDAAVEFIFKNIDHIALFFEATMKKVPS